MGQAAMSGAIVILSQMQILLSSNRPLLIGAVFDSNSNK